MPSPGSDTSSLEIEYQTEESDIRAGSENIVKIEYSSESNENTSDLISEDLPEDSYTRPGSESKVMIKHPSEESSYSSTTSVNMSESEYLSGSSYNTSVSLSKYLPIRYSDVISEHLPEHSDTRPDNANIMIKHSSEESSYASTTSVNMSESEYLSGSSYNTSVSLSEYLPKRSESVDVAVEEKVSSEQKTPPVFRAPVDSMEGFVVSSRREPGIPEKIPVPLGSINVPRAPQNSFVRAERGGTRGPCAPVDSMEGFIVNSRGEPGIPEKIPVPLGSINVPRAPQNSFVIACSAQRAALAERGGTGGAFRQDSLISTDNFRFCRWLGQGTFGQVYQAEHKETRKMLAIKRVDKQHYSENNIVEMLFLERDILRLARNSRNPFLVSLFCSFQSEHHAYIAMEFAAGGSLASRLKNGALPYESTLFYSACIVLGIKFLHENHIVHRDLKPDNIVLDSAGYAKLADFGLCKTGIDYGTEMTHACGTKCYCTPELFWGKSYNRTVDWWALGVTIYEMAVGKLPFTGVDEKLSENVRFAEPRYPPRLDKRTVAIIKALLKKEPTLRLGADKDDGEEVQKFCYFEPIDWKALEDRQLPAPFIPSQDVHVAQEEQRGIGVATPPQGMWPLPSAMHEAFAEFEELPEAL
ncbi:serine/threonine-protein kinase N1-like isoform X2 [Xenopus laevis]|uniref:non-specific serine/threonine protein kinase n=1 Tax=Xenopus laevis TaxID=8355 RepID=A0A8J1LJH9_XENLA|nr:serine/threonine-protein kinase N1-like isoform X2 [Xenopus laevis]